MKIDAGSKVKTARTWLCFQRPCASVVSGDVRVTLRITLLTRKCPAVRFALLTYDPDIVIYASTLEGGRASTGLSLLCMDVGYKQWSNDRPLCA